MQKGFAPILILVGILIIMVVAGGAFYFGRQTTPKPQTQNPVVTSTPQPSPSPDETSNWKTYTNTKNGYSFKYPSDWSISGIGPGGAEYTSGSATRADAGTIHISTPMQCPTGLPNAGLNDCSEGIDIDFLDNPKNLSAEEYARYLKWNQAQYKSITINHITWLMADEIQKYGVALFLQKGSKIYMINANKPITPTENLILSTFRFLP